MALSHPTFPICLLPSSLKPSVQCPGSPIPASFPSLPLCSWCILFLDSSPLLFHPCRPKPRPTWVQLFPNASVRVDWLGQRRGRRWLLWMVQWFSNCAAQNPPAGATVWGEGQQQGKGLSLSWPYTKQSCLTFFCVICLLFHILFLKRFCGGGNDAGECHWKSYPGCNDNKMSKKSHTKLMVLAQETLKQTKPVTLLSRFPRTVLIVRDKLNYQNSLTLKM